MIGKTIYLLALLLATIVVPSWSMIAIAQERAVVRDRDSNVSPTKVYGGEPLEVWQRRFGEVKPTSEYAAELVPGLLEIVEDRQAPDVFRERAAITLGRIGKPAIAAVPVLGELLADTNEPLLNRVWAGRALGYFGKYASSVAERLVDFLFDESTPLEHRPVPVEALGRIGSGHPSVLPALLRLFEYTTDEDDSLSAGDVARLRELATEAFTMMGQDADVATPLLMRAARNPAEVETIRRKSIVAIGEIGPSAAVAISTLLESLEFDPSEAVRDEAAKALAKLGDPAWVMLERYLAHPDPTVRSRIAIACGTLQPPPRNIANALQHSLMDPAEDVRMAVAESLSKLAIARSETMPAMITLLKSDDRQIRMRAMRLILEQRPLRNNELAALSELSQHDLPATARIAQLLLKKLDETETD